MLCAKYSQSRKHIISLSTITLVQWRNFTTSSMHRAPKAMLTRLEPADVSVNSPRDPNTLSNYHNFKTTHTAVDYTIDFEKKRFRGSVILDLVSTTHEETNEIVLDTSFLDIDNIKINGKSREYNIAPRIEPYGSPLSIKLESGVPKDKTVQVEVRI